VPRWSPPTQLSRDRPLISNRQMIGRVVPIFPDPSAVDNAADPAFGGTVLLSTEPGGAHSRKQAIEPRALPQEVGLGLLPLKVAQKSQHGYEERSHNKSNDCDVVDLFNRAHLWFQCIGEIPSEQDCRHYRDS